MTRMRVAFVLVPLLLSAALVATLLGTQHAVRGAVGTLVLGQGDAILDALSNYPGDRLERGFLETMLAEQQPDGLRCIVVFDRSIEVREVVGDCLAADGPGLRSALLDVPPHEVFTVDDRVRMTRGLPREGPRELPLSRDPVMVEFEPLMRRELEAGALRSLGIGGVASLALVLVALGLWRFSLREERLKAVMERDRRLASLGEMAAVLAHEIRNPLTSMKGHAQLLAEQLDAESAEGKKADLVVAEAEKLQRLTIDLLAFVRSENVARQDVDPRSVVEAAAEDVGRDRVEIDADSAPTSWSLDPRLLRQALSNLLRNALQASKEHDPASVVVGCVGNSLFVDVRDRGEGIAEEERDRIFEPFYTTRVKGTGLGLSVARRIVTLHRGQISTSNHPQGGAVFRVEIPAG